MKEITKKQRNSGSRFEKKKYRNSLGFHLKINLNISLSDFHNTGRQRSAVVLQTLQLIWIQQSIRNVILRLFFDKFIDVMLSSMFGC